MQTKNRGGGEVGERVIVIYRYADSEAIFNEMSHDNVQPDPHLLITMRDVYKRAGQAEKAQAMNAAAKKLSYESIRNSPFTSVYTTSPSPAILLTPLLEYC